MSDTVCGTMCMCVGCLRLWPWAVVAGLSTSSACFTQWSTACMQAGLGTGTCRSVGAYV